MMLGCLVIFCIKAPSTLGEGRQGAFVLKTKQSPVIMDLCLRKARSEKSRDHRDVIVRY